ncbi:probable G-protein coupled receptor CG31760 [Saccostrea echinata]|uniref:probable G-protein coupled receptor CG31760 n=1 Tax=Saccostrea echinata TaxID=191078 RepID=UPI002A82B6C1|nr:probable G-protein coupled receptor CG31760 [Saccostrea echinata]
MSQEVHRQAARQALDYVAFIENLDNCSLGTGESLDLTFDHTVWNPHALAAVRLANFISKVISSNNNSMASLSDDVLFALVRNNVHLKSVIFGSGTPFEPHESLRYPLFCPYAYRDENKTSVLSKDIAVEYNYTDPRTEYYNVLRYRDFSNISLEIDKIQFRSGDSLLPAVEVMQPVATLEDGHWTKPYFDCGGGNVWMVTYSSPIFGLGLDKKSVVFRGVATIDVELTNVDVNQCDVGTVSTKKGMFDIFRGTHLCQPSTVCVFTPGHGFGRGAYICTCAKGYFFPSIKAEEKFYNGSDIENSYKDNMTSLSQYRCTPCAPGCAVCIDSSPCLFTRNMAMKVIILVLTIIIIILILLVSALVYRLRENKVMKSGSPIFLLLMCTGGALMCLQMFVLFPDANDILCMILPWLYHLGFFLMYGALLLKTWRISVIFRRGQLKKVHMTDKTLLRHMAVILAAVFGYLVAWTAANDETSKVVKTSSGLKFVMCTENWWSYSAYGMEILMLLFGVYLCFTVHKAPASFNESKHISWSIYNAIIVSTFILIVNYFTAESVGPDLIYAMVFLNCQVVVTTTIAMIFLPKFYAVHMKVEVRRRDSLKTITGRMKSYSSSGQHRSIAVQTMISGEDTEDMGIWKRDQKDGKPADESINGKFEKFVPFVYIQGSVVHKEL